MAQHHSVGTKCGTVVIGTVIPYCRNYLVLDISSYISAFKFLSIKNRPIKILFKISA